MKGEMFKIFKEAMSIDAKNKVGDAKEQEINYGKWKDINRTTMPSKHPEGHWVVHHQ